MDRSNLFFMFCAISGLLIIIMQWNNRPCCICGQNVEDDKSVEAVGRNVEYDKGVEAVDVVFTGDVVNKLENGHDKQDDPMLIKLIKQRWLVAPSNGKLNLNNDKKKTIHNLEKLNLSIVYLSKRQMDST